MGTAFFQILFTNSLFACIKLFFFKFPTNIYLKLDPLGGAYFYVKKKQKLLAGIQDMCYNGYARTPPWLP